MEMATRGLIAVALASCFGTSSSQSQYFEVLEYRDPTQCERMQCQSVRSEYCREHQKGFYMKEKGCPEGMICTNCEFGNTTHPTKCKCENPPFSLPVLYGQECNLGAVCTEGQGICFRPCDTFLHVTLCEATDHCRWNTTTYKCENKPPSMPLVEWADLPRGTPFSQGTQILSMMGAALFPQDFEDFKKSAHGYTLQGFLLSDLIQLESMFLQLDANNDGLLQETEYQKLPNTLAALDAAAIARTAASSNSRRLEDGEFERHLAEFNNEEPDRQIERMLQTASNGGGSTTGTTTTTAVSAGGSGSGGPAPATSSGPPRNTTTSTTTLTPAPAPAAVIVRPEACGAMVPKKYFCSFDQSCKTDCKECGWKSATDSAFAMCVRPTALTCHADGGQEFCPTDQSCHTDGDCSKCVDRPVVDHASHLCLAVWWLPDPSTQWTNWVCRDRNKVGMPCRNDQDCIYGLKKCLGGECQPLQPYNQNLTCATDLDCPHLGYYCPSDPTGGENIYWVQYCRRQKRKDETCKEDRQCVPDTRCNTAEAQPRCRRYFSLPIGTPSKDDTLCSLGWRDRFGKCAPPAKSKEAGRACDSDRDCITTDATGRTGRCRCKSWWDKDDSKYCEPVTGDYENYFEKRRDYVFFRFQNCGSFWTEEECLKIFAGQARTLKLKMQCETQKLSKGPYLPPPDCNPPVYYPEKYPDYCAQLAR